MSTPKKYPVLKPATKESRLINKLQSDLKLATLSKDAYGRKIDNLLYEVKRLNKLLVIEQEINYALRKLYLKTDENDSK